jgi:hypothetical protein
MPTRSVSGATAVVMLFGLAFHAEVFVSGLSHSTAQRGEDRRASRLIVFSLRFALDCSVMCRGQEWAGDRAQLSLWLKA